MGRKPKSASHTNDTTKAISINVVFGAMQQPGDTNSDDDTHYATVMGIGVPHLSCLVNLLPPQEHPAFFLVPCLKEKK